VDRLPGMSLTEPISIFLPSEEDTTRLGTWLAPRLRAGDTVLLSGPIGAGKSQFARAVIRARLGRAEDVPSPTFTLVQTYEAEVEIWHSDLYRLSHPDEILELGLDEAFSSAICLVEWPDRLGALAPEDAISICLSAQNEGRSATIDVSGRAQLCADLRQDWVV
jgi:tRNA threonylcarbamoyladenosine biosynthesis protein TsaE